MQYTESYSYPQIENVFLVPSLSLSLSLSFCSARGSRHPICPVHTDGPQCPLTGAYAGCILILRAESAVKVRVRTNSAWNEVLSLPIHYPKYNSWVPRTKSIKYKTTLSIFWTQGQNQTQEQIQPKDRSAGSGGLDMESCSQGTGGLMGQVCRSPRYRPECSCIKLLQFPKNRTIHPNRVLCIEQTASHTRVVNANSLSQAQTTAVQDLCQTVTVGHRC